MKTYLFCSKDGFNVVQLKDDQEAKHRAESINTKTFQVMTMDGRVIWQDNNRSL